MRVPSITYRNSDKIERKTITDCTFTMVPFSMMTSKTPLLKGRSSMSASRTFISDD